MGKVGGNVQPKKSTNLKPTIILDMFLLFIKDMVAKYIIRPTINAVN